MILEKVQVLLPICSIASHSLLMLWHNFLPFAEKTAEVAKMTGWVKVTEKLSSEETCPICLCEIEVPEMEKGSSEEDGISPSIICLILLVLYSDY